MNLRHICAAFLAAAASACASAPAVNPNPSLDRDRTAEVLAAARRWTGTLNPTQGRTGAAVTTTRQRAYGTVELTVAPNRQTNTHVRLTVSVPAEPGLNNLGWAVHPGTCGSGNPPVIAPGMFPTMVLSANGRGTIDDDVPFQLPESGNYHVNVFRGGGTQLNDVITCAELRKQR
jgi:hypothetical protein